MNACLYAIPTPLGGPAEEALPPRALGIVRSLRDFAVENAKSARAFLKAAGCDPKEARIEVLDGTASMHQLLEPLRQGRSLGLLSEAGCPAIADPGALLVDEAHRQGIRVVPLVGPSSIVLALMASGLEGQRFAFCGYLPRETGDRRRRILEIERRSQRERETQIFIETPYRNDSLAATLLSVCSPDTVLCLASDLTLPGERVETRTVLQWRRTGAGRGKAPTVFLLLAR